MNQCFNYAVNKEEHLRKICPLKVYCRFFGHFYYFDFSVILGQGGS